MIPTPFRFEPEMMPDEFQTVGRLTLKWSHIEHIVGNCLKRILRLTDEEAIVVVFPLNIETRLNRILELSKIKPMKPRSQSLLAELRPLMRGIQYLRTSVVHAIVVENDKSGDLFHLRSRRRNVTKAEIFSSEEITNYTAHVVIA